jgi:hypothetical protein
VEVGRSLSAALGVQPLFVEDEIRLRLSAQTEIDAAGRSTTFASDDVRCGVDKWAEETVEDDAYMGSIDAPRARVCPRDVEAMAARLEEDVPGDRDEWKPRAAEPGNHAGLVLRSQRLTDLRERSVDAVGENGESPLWILVKDCLIDPIHVVEAAHLLDRWEHVPIVDEVGQVGLFERGLAARRSRIEEKHVREVRRDIADRPVADGQPVCVEVASEQGRQSLTGGGDSKRRLIEARKNNRCEMVPGIALITP